MIIRAIDSNSDWQFGQGINSYRITQDAIMQNIRTKILEWKGDCFFNMNAGIDWINRLDKRQEDILNQELKSLILKCFGVVELNELSVKVVNRIFTADYTIKTIFSPSAQDVINEQL